ncbi:hypothetical protein [Streptomyces hygroscopicus]|uniref:hypothetical protein n=1 Tax=Streptomyces hygroscopicus TaxID=1912 RepID=UPI001FCA09D9|nr:hypothetical protein [Streptomyces hygroscopicus]
MLLPTATAAAADVAVAVKLGHWLLHVDPHCIKLAPLPRRRQCRGAGGWWTSGPFPEMEACRCWADRRTLRLPLRPVRATDPWPDEPLF